jgi:hypothetical protein
MLLGPAIYRIGTKQVGAASSGYSITKMNKPCELFYGFEIRRSKKAAIAGGLLNEGEDRLLSIA